MPKAAKVASKPSKTKTTEYIRLLLIDITPMPEQSRKSRPPASLQNTKIPTVHVGPVEALEGTNPDRSATDTMKEVVVIWRDSLENPNRGKAPRPKKKKAAKPGSSSEPSSSSSPSCSLESAPSSDL